VPSAISAPHPLQVTFDIMMIRTVPVYPAIEYDNPDTYDTARVMIFISILWKPSTHLLERLVIEREPPPRIDMSTKARTPAPGIRPGTPPGHTTGKAERMLVNLPLSLADRIIHDESNAIEAAD
jgi:hypothetical protein